MKFFSLLFILATQISWATCLETKNFISTADQLYGRQQYLLSAVHFSSASLMDCSETQLKSKAQVGYLYSLYNLGEKDEAFKYLTEIDQKLSPDYQKKLDVFKAVQLKVGSDIQTQKRIEAFENWKESLPNPKSPGLAAGLSAILPGSGQAYAGSYQSAAVAFLLNALFLSATLELSRKELPSAALASGLVFSITYFGNIVNASKTASTVNENYNRKQIEDQRNNLFPELKP